MPSIKLILFTIVAVFISAVVSEFKVLTPNSKFYGVVKENLTITWTSSGNDVPQAITIKLVSKTHTDLFTGEYAVGQSIPTSSGKYNWTLTDNLVGENNWILKFYNALSEFKNDTSTVAQSEEFSIKPAGTSLPKNDTSTNNSTNNSTVRNDSNDLNSFSSISLYMILFTSFISSVMISNLNLF